ncbi:uncharacterized protein BX664DRAFT_326684 [Halteromyces radiatus]|uniref:uncharacterized protein n=1 Tax=Halteromyces radiatus TaxID=101107 RepID=UPI0022203EF1|nr:uncharacterized protein BX664DRAFT_326684 [Halteromyces radiatus]KAI8097558.1 hypothetical protein BX664DRAFT_326684 [Halteromyces radiatus]
MVCYVLFTKSSSTHICYVLYPLVPLIHQLGTISAQVTFYINNRENSILSQWASLSNGICGFLLLLVFLMDPIFWHFIRSFWSKSTLENKHDEEEMGITIFDKNDSKQNQEDGYTKSSSMTSSLTTQTNTSDGPTKPVAAFTSTATKNLTPIEIENTTYRRSYQPSLSPEMPNIFFPPPPSPTHTRNHPTSLELEERDFIDMLKPAPLLQLDTATDHTTLLSPVIMMPICYEMEDAVPWRVLEADDEDEEGNDTEHNNDMNSPPTTPHHQQINGSRISSCPRVSTVSSSPSYRKESWLSLYDDDDNGRYSEEMDRKQQHLSEDDRIYSTSSSSQYTVSEWLAKRGDSLDGVREQVGRTSKSIRRWCRNVNRQQEDTFNDKYDDLPRQMLHVVPEEQQK